jgi:hypothetical protein
MRFLNLLAQIPDRLPLTANNSIPYCTHKTMLILIFCTCLRINKNNNRCSSMGAEAIVIA